MTETVRLRPATLEDAERLFQWRNDSLTRAQSLQQQPVEWQAHLNWLQASLQNPDRQIYIAESAALAGQEQSLLLGTVRADKTAGEYELSWTVAPEQRGKGWGRQMVAALIECLPSGATYTAVVLLTNPASHRIAVALAMQVKKHLATQTIYSGRKPVL